MILLVYLISHYLFTWNGFWRMKLNVNIIISPSLRSLDRALHSLGPRSGYVLTKRTYPNPVDMMLLYAQRVSSTAVEWGWGEGEGGGGGRTSKWVCAHQENLPQPCGHDAPLCSEGKLNNGQVGVRGMGRRRERGGGGRRRREEEGVVGPRSGYVLTKRTYPNPVDMMLLYAQRVSSTTVR